MDGDAALRTVPFVGRAASAELEFASGGGRTFLARQRSPHPFHLTRPFHLDAREPGLATLYLQSSSGGLFRGDDLELAIAVRRGAQVHVTTQAATIVHDTGSAGARQGTTLRVAEGGFLAYTPDPLVLFPGADLLSETKVALAADATAIVVEAFACHDPEGRGRGFARLRQDLAIGDGGGRLLVRERGALSGDALYGAASPLGRFRACATVHVLAPPRRLPDPLAIQASCDAVRCLAGASDLPNGAGRMIRCLAENGGDLRRGLDALFALAFEAVLGFVPAPRRK